MTIYQEKYKELAKAQKTEIKKENIKLLIQEAIMLIT